eukprot:9448295-Pyramimonas_sp.AAC.1
MEQVRKRGGRKRGVRGRKRGARTDQVRHRLRPPVTLGDRKYSVAHQNKYTNKQTNKSLRDSYIGRSKREADKEIGE